jgi:alkanesulfonate monooxygenase SsuD/methylene tetrahydromethanopterin reductase-like flavin-dependent oxidoreductase (luciferase family)
MADVLSGGRLDLGVGSGYLSQEYDGFMVPFKDKRERFDEALEFLLDLWGGRVREHPGPHFPSPAIGINVEPVQRPHPPVWIAVVRAEAVRPVARKGFPLMLIPYAVTLLDQHLALFSTAYRSAAPSRPFPGLTAAYHAVVAPTVEEARATTLPYLRRYIASRVQHIGGTAEQIVDNELLIAGDPAACIDRIRRLQACGVEHLLLITSFGGMPPALVERSNRLLAEEVMPAFSGPSLDRAAVLAVESVDTVPVPS